MDTLNENRDLLFIIGLYKDYLNNGLSKKDLIALIGLDTYNNINPSNYF